MAVSYPHESLVDSHQDGCTISCDMAPGLSIHDEVNTGIRHPEHRTKGFHKVGTRGVETPDFAHRALCELGVQPLSLRLSVLPNLVGGIPRVRCKEKMIGADASGIVAPMADAHPLGNLAVMQQPRNAVYAQLSTTTLQLEGGIASPALQRKQPTTLPTLNMPEQSRSNIWAFCHA